MRRITAIIVLLLMTVLTTACATSGSDRSSMQKAAQLNAQLGANYLQQGSLELANEKLTKALRQDDDNVDAHATYALLLMELDKPGEARRHFREALDLAPDNPDIHNNFGTFLCEQGDYKQGIEHFLEAAENRLYNTPEYAYANAGACARDAGRTDEARRYLRQALELNPQMPSPLRELTELEFDRGQPESAQAYLERYHETYEPSARTLLLATRIERRLGNQERSREFGRSLLRNFPDSEEAERFLEER